MASSINPADIDSFLDRVETVEQELKALMSGDMPVPRTTTAGKPAQIAAPVVDEDFHDPNTGRWDAERRAREAHEERERWWKLAELHFGGPDAAPCGPSPPPPPKSKVQLAPKDYKKWDSWVPQDPVTIEEEAVQRRAREAQADVAFEASNASFVESFHADAARRKAAEAAKVAQANRAKERGNAAFKRGDSRAAIAAYHEALLLTPFNAALLNNLTLVHLQLARAAPHGSTAAAAPSASAGAAANSEPSALDSALEFSRRVLRVEPQNVKALFRRATALLLCGDLSAAERDLRAAAAVDPADDEVRRLLESTRLDLDEATKEAHADRLAREQAAAPSEGEGAECDTAPSPAPLPWEQPLLRLCTAFADFSEPATRASSSVAVEPAVFGAVLRLLDVDDARVAFRISGALGRLSTAVSATAAQLRAATPPLSHLLDAAAFAGACTCLAAAADNPKNRALLASGGVLVACLGLLSAPPAEGRQGVVEGGAVCSALHVVDACCRGEGISALDARAAVARHDFFSPPHSASARGSRGGGPPGAASHRSVAELLLAVARGVTESALSDLRASGGPLESLEVCCGVIQCLAAGAGSYEPPPAEKPPAGAAAVPLADVPCEALAAWGAAGGSGGIVGALLAAAEAVLQRAGGARDAAGAALLSCGAMQRCVGALANLAQLSALRPSFVGDAAPAAPPRGDGVSAARPRVQPLLKLLMAAAAAGSVGSDGGGTAAAFETEGWLVVVGSAVAALANASLGTPAVAEYLCASGVPRCLLGLVLPPPGRNGGEAAYELPARAAALLGRLSALPSALATLREPQALRSLTGALCAAAGTVGGPAAASASPTGASSVPASRALLQDSLVRTVAGAASSSAPSSPTDASGAAALMASGGGLRATVAIINSQLASLRLTPGAPGAGRFIGLGNACKLIGALLDSGAEAASPAALLAAGGVDALVGALKLEGGSGDPQAAAVRRNASVALARAVRDAACMARARELRGIEILMQLQLSK